MGAREYFAGERVKEITAVRFAVRVIITILLLQFLFPNLVHEPLHLLALNVLGHSGMIVFDWVPPATPVVNYVLENAELWQVLLVFLLPSVVNVVLIGVLSYIKTNIPVIKIGVIAYLAFDLFENIKGFNSPTSDFRFLQVVPAGDALAIFMIVIIIALALWGVWKSLLRVKIVKVIKKENVVPV